MTDAGDTLLGAVLDGIQRTPEGVPTTYDPATTAWLPVPNLAAELEAEAEAATRQAMLEGADTKTGAPTAVRAAVGAATTDAQRLATLRKSYPDAEVVPGTSGNFVYTDPSSGRRLTYAPMGLRIPTMGDVASVGPELAATAGGVAGGLLGSAVAGPGVGSAIGGGVGATAAREAYQRLAPSLLDMAPETRGPGAQAIEAGADLALNAALPWAGGKVAGFLANELRGTGGPVREAADALERAGVVPSGFSRSLLPGVVTGNPALQRIESAMAQAPLSGGVRAADKATREGVETGVTTMAGRAAAGGVVPDPETFASNVSGVARRALDNFQAQRAMLDDAATAAIGPGRATDLQPLRDLRAELAKSLAAAPQSLAGRYQPAIDRIDAMLGDAAKAGGTLPFGVVRNLRTDLGSALDWSERYGATDPTGIPAQKQLYGRLKDVLMDTADSAGPSARAALTAHDDWVRLFNAEGGPRETFAALADPATRADKLVQLMRSTAPGDTDALANIRHFATPADLAELQAGTIQRLGQTREGAFDATTWARNFNATTQPARDLMFGPAGPGSLQESLSQLATVQNAVRSAGRTAGFSNTAAVLTALGALSAMGGAVAAGDTDRLAGAAAGLAAPFVAGRLMTSRPFVRWLTGTFAVNPASAAQWGQHLARLGAVAKADPAVADLVDQYRSQLPDKLP